MTKNYLIIALLMMPFHSTESVEWHSLPEAMAMAQSNNTPVFIYVNAAWCGPCKMMEQEVFPNTTSLLNRFTLASLDFDDHETTIMYAGQQLSAFEWARHMGVEATPGFVLTESDGTLITHFTGFLDQQRFSLLLAFVATGAYQHASFEAYVSQMHLN